MARITYWRAVLDDRDSGRKSRSIALPVVVLILSERVALFGQLAALTGDPGLPLSQLTAMYETDDRLRVPGTVFNAALNRADRIAPDEPQSAGR